ncbi:MAG TPA: hypothetical protein VLA93_11080 [Pyrinomonadaceae bacterium]|nr:hypothetical protein [Pyrinomonadaceae bacterium]
MTTQRLTEPATVTELERRRATNAQDETQRASRMMLRGFIIMFVGAAIGVIGKMLVHWDPLTVFGVLISLAGIFLAAYPYLVPSRRPKYESTASQPELITRSQPKHLPEEREIEYVPSITERTTDLLKTPTATRPKQKEDGPPSDDEGGRMKDEG